MLCSWLKHFTYPRHYKPTYVYFDCKYVKIIYVKYFVDCIAIPVKDDRLRCVKELVYAEEVYNDCLKSLFELYAEPLK